MPLPSLGMKALHFIVKHPRVVTGGLSLVASGLVGAGAIIGRLTAPKALVPMAGPLAAELMKRR